MKSTACYQNGCHGDRFYVSVERPIRVDQHGENNESMTSDESVNKPLLELRDVVKVYATAAGEFTALKGINIQVGKGEFIGIVGKSGAGKSTLLNMITGVDHLTSGEVLAHTNGSSISLHKLSEDQIALWRGHNLGVVFQSFQLLPMLTLVENITLPMDLCGRFNSKQSRERALELLRLVEIESHADKLPAHISGGQQQRVAIARALANDPPLLVADEPTGSLDSVTAEHIFEVFEHLVNDLGKTIIMVTHDETLSPRFTRTLRIADGELVSVMESPNGSKGNGRHEHA
ncbi:MAG TPA: ABC transporter ATP-binding protein [Anaerolineales bacterium]|nr:ABC transporter ATP-binding protein [Anaerolineales bacterium]